MQICHCMPDPHLPEEEAFVNSWLSKHLAVASWPIRFVVLLNSCRAALIVTTARDGRWCIVRYSVEKAECDGFECEMGGRRNSKSDPDKKKRVCQHSQTVEVRVITER